MDVAKMPLMDQALAEMAVQTRQDARSQSVLVESGRSISNGDNQAVEVTDATRRKPARIYRLNPGMTQAEMTLVCNAIYSQVMDIFDGQVPEQFRRPDLESKLRNSEITVREFVQTLASSETYISRFYTPYPSAKVVEFLFRHLLGRAPVTQAETQQYSSLLAGSGLKATVEAIVKSAEYVRYFGEDVVPYKRVSTPLEDTALNPVKVEVERV
jgi:phycobilisome core-membrane linker protein